MGFGYASNVINGIPHRFRASGSQLLRKRLFEAACSSSGALGTGRNFISVSPGDSGESFCKAPIEGRMNLFLARRECLD
jgi:hypothetical protein